MPRRACRRSRPSTPRRGPRSRPRWLDGREQARRQRRRTHVYGQDANDVPAAGGRHNDEDELSVDISKERRMPGALDGIKILELTRVGPGGFCTMMLADMGAEVLKIEAPPSGKLAGSGASPRPEDARKLATSFTNRNKKSMTLNLKDPAGQAILRELVKSYDVLVEGFRPGVMQRLGGDYETLKKLNPRLVYC